MATEARNVAPRTSTDMAKEVLRQRLPGYADSVIDTLATSGKNRSDVIKNLTPVLGDARAAETAFEQAQEVMRQAGIRDKIRSKWLDRAGMLIPWPIRKLGGWMWRNKVKIGVTALALGAGGYAAYMYWDKLLALFPGLAAVKEYLIAAKAKAVALGAEAKAAGAEAFGKIKAAVTGSGAAPGVPGGPGGPVVPPMIPPAGPAGLNPGGVGGVPDFGGAVR